jgi:hypothetical protein
LRNKTTAAVCIARKSPDAVYYFLVVQNGHKHWISGWFDSRAVEVEPLREGTVSLRLAGFVLSLNDTSLSEDDAFVVRVGNDLYLQYNRGTGYNVDTMFPNTVTITQDMGIDHDGSIHLAALSVGERYKFPNYSDKGHPLIIEVCQPPNSLPVDESGNFATISIHVDNGIDRTACTYPYSQGNLWNFAAGFVWPSLVALACLIPLAILYQCRRMGEIKSPDTSRRRLCCGLWSRKVSPAAATEKPTDEETVTCRGEDDDCALAEITIEVIP